MVATRDGVYSITVQAADGDGETATATFDLTVAISGPNGEDNDTPDITLGTVTDVNENVGEGRVVATFTVEDDDNDLTGHPFSVDPMGGVMITSVVNNDDSGDEMNWTGGGQSKDMTYASAFKLVHTGTSGNTYTFQVRTTDAAEGHAEPRDGG